jgi:hypothetical protein
VCSHPQGAALEVKAHNQRAIRLYERLGFQAVGRRAKFYACGADALLMRRQPGSDDGTPGACACLFLLLGSRVAHWQQQ